MRPHIRHEVLVRLKTAIECEKFDFPAAFGSLPEGLGTCSGHLKTVTGDLAGTGRARLGGMHAPPGLVITAEYDPLRDGRARRYEIGVGGVSGATMEGHAATAIVLPLDLANHLALIKTSDVTNIAGVIAVEKSWRD